MLTYFANVWDQRVLNLHIPVIRIVPYFPLVKGRL
jgi:hypothetical protein